MSFDIHGTFAALLTPRLPDDTVDTGALEALVGFLKTRGVAGCVVNGATGEYCLTTPPQLRSMMGAVRKASGGSMKMICGVGAAGIPQVLELASVAVDHKADAVLVPPPHFFPYAQEDLDAFYREVAARVKLPILLYNIPQFTSPIDAETASRLIRDVPNIAGIKDSSGSLQTLRILTHSGPPACRIVGNDAVLVDGMREGVCDAVISGVACVLPEVILSIVDQAGAPENGANVSLQEFLDAIGAFPVPWGLRWAAEALGILRAWSSQPVSQSRAAEAARFKAWFAPWHSTMISKMGVSNSRQGTLSHVHQA